MIALFMILAWVIGGLSTYRRVGYEIEQSTRAGHEFQAVCDSCICKNCGGRWGYHFEYKLIGHSCNNFEFAPRIHLRTFFIAFPTLVFWPAIAAIFGIIKAKSMLGLETKPFFVPAPVVESKQERQARLLAEREVEIIAREKDIDARERQLEIGPYANRG